MSKPWIPWVHNQVGVLYSRIGNSEQAIKYFRREIEVKPDGAGITYGNLASYVVDDNLDEAIAHYRNGNWQQAIDALTKSLESNTPLGFDAFFLAMAHWQLDQKDEAMQWYDKAVAWLDESAADDAELVRFRGEAEELMEIDSSESSEADRQPDSATVTGENEPED